MSGVEQAVGVARRVVACLRDCAALRFGNGATDELSGLIKQGRAFVHPLLPLAESGDGFCWEVEWFASAIEASLALAERLALRLNDPAARADLGRTVAMWSRAGTAEWQRLAVDAECGRLLCSAPAESDQSSRAPETIDTRQDVTVLEVASILTLGKANEVLSEAVQLANDKSKTVADRLSEFVQMVPSAANLSSRQLAEILRTSHTMIQDTNWWKTNRAGQHEVKVAQRKNRYRERGERYEPD